MSDKRTVLFVNKEGIENDKILKKEALDSCREFIKMTTDCGVIIDDYREFFVNPIQYTQNKYFEANSDKLPSAISPSKSLIFTSFDNTRATELQQIITRKISQVTITKNDVTTSTNMELYTYVLDESKRVHYEILLKYIETFNELSKYGDTRTGLMGKSVEGLKFDHLKVWIDYHYFRDKN
jgi:hypothetical protein